MCVVLKCTYFYDCVNHFKMKNEKKKFKCYYFSRNIPARSDINNLAEFNNNYSGFLFHKIQIYLPTIDFMHFICCGFYGAVACTLIKK